MKRIGLDLLRHETDLYQNKQIGLYTFYQAIVT